MQITQKLLSLSLLSVLTTALDASEWYTATSLSVGTKSFSHLPQSLEFRADQYFINDALPEIYYKAGYFHEALKIWDTEVDTAENILLGVGYNIVDYKGYFVDLGASGAYRFSTSTATNANAYAEYNDPVILPFAEVGLGYSFDSFTLRMDILMSLIGQGEVTVIDKTTKEQTNYNYDMLHVNLGVAYWW